jgi:hypothetical protein
MNDGPETGDQVAAYYIPCQCGEVAHFLHLYYWRVKPVRELCISVGSVYGVAPPLRERIAAAWKMLRGRRHFFNEAVVLESSLKDALATLEKEGGA